MTVELDRTTVAQPAWANGGRVIVAVEAEDRATGARASATETLAAGDRLQVLYLPDDQAPPLPAGRYRVRVEVLASDAKTPVVVSTIVDVPGTAGLLGSAMLVSRWGPGTGRQFEATADARFRRTERLQAEVARIDPSAVVAARLLNRAGQPMQVPVAVSERPVDDRRPPAIVAELALAPLAAGEYVLEVTATRGDLAETRGYAIRLVP